MRSNLLLISRYVNGCTPNARICMRSAFLRAAQNTSAPIPRRIIAGGTSAERKTAERGNYMNKTGFKATVIVCGAILAILGAALTFMLCNIVPTAWMERVEINGRVIPVTGAELNYEADTPVWKGGVADGVLVMKDGTKYDIKYSMDHDVFTIKDKFGMYVSRA